MIAPARNVGRYEIREKLGRGGMADVYMAQDTRLGHVVALKLIEHSVDQDTRDSIAAERRGAELQAHLAAIDPHVARVFDTGDVERYFYVAMEYVDGQDLSEVMRRPLTPEYAVDVAIAVAETLDHAHNLQVASDGKLFRGIVHGDIKPKNIRIDSRGHVRVLDFGIAKALSMSRKLTRNEFGSVPYASPERLDLGEVNALSDLWSLAVMLYEMVTGMQPYQADGTERLERMIRSRVAPPPAPDPCPEPLRQILIKALSPEPDLRYQSAQELSNELMAYRGGEIVRAAEEDRDATRRTSRSDDETRRTSRRESEDHSGDDGDDTRRTGKAAVPTPVKVKKPSAWRQLGKGMRVIAALALGCILWGGAAAVADYLRYERGQDLKHEIDAEQLTDPSAIWTRWTELSQGHSSSFYLSGARKAVRQKLVEAGDHVIGTYRNNDNLVVYENTWKNAREWFAHALEAEPDDSVRGRVRLCEGHIARIEKDYNQAIEKFDEAARLMPHSADPELGLARVYVYGVKDIDKAYDALEEAKLRGYQLGNREKSQLADGYRDRADRVWWDSRNVRGLPQEKDQIHRAMDDYQRALELYQGIAGYGTATTQIIRVQNSIDSVEFRLREIDPASVPADAPPNSGPGKLVRLLKRIWP